MMLISGDDPLLVMMEMILSRNNGNNPYQRYLGMILISGDDPLLVMMGMIHVIGDADDLCY